MVQNIDVHGTLPFPEPTPPPKTIIVPSDYIMTNYSPQDVPNPLFSKDERELNLTASIISDFLIEVFIPISDPRLLNNGTITVKNMNGKEIVISSKVADDSCKNSKIKHGVNYCLLFSAGIYFFTIFITITIFF